MNLFKIRTFFQKQLALKNFSIYIIGKLIALFFSFLLLPLFTHKLPKEEFGIVGLLWLIVPLTRRLIDLGSDVSVTLKFFKLDKETLSNYLYHSFSIIIINLVFWVILLSILPFKISEISLKGQIIIVAIATLQSINSLWASFSRLEGNAKRYVIITNLPPILTAFITAFLIFKINASYLSYLWGMLIGQGILTLFAPFSLFKRYHTKFFHPKIKIYKQILTVGIPVIPGTMSAIILAYGDRFVIENIMGLSYVAIYTLGYRMAEYFLITFIQPLQNTLTPKIMRLAHENILEAENYIENLLRKIVIGISLSLIIILIPMKALIVFIGGEGYANSYGIFLLILIGVFISNVTDFSRILFSHFEKTHLGMILNLFIALINIGLNYLLIPRLGVEGACWATIAAFSIQQPLIVILTNKYLPRKLRMRKIINLQLLGVIYIAALYIVENYKIGNQLFDISIKISLSLVIFSLLLYLSPELKQKIYQFTPWKYQS